MRVSYTISLFLIPLAAASPLSFESSASIHSSVSKSHSVSEKASPSIRGYDNNFHIAYDTIDNRFWGSQNSYAKVLPISNKGASSFLISGDSVFFTVTHSYNVPNTQTLSVGPRVKEWRGPY